MLFSWVILYANNLVIIAESLKELHQKLVLWKVGMESKGLRVKMSKTKIVVSCPGMAVLRKIGMKLRASM